MKEAEKISPKSLIKSMRITPADNGEGFKTAIPWKSKLVGEQVRMLFRLSKFLELISEKP